MMTPKTVARRVPWAYLLSLGLLLLIAGASGGSLLWFTTDFPRLVMPQPQVGELWEYPRIDPSPWEHATLVYEVCEISGNWIRYVHHEYTTCAAARSGASAFTDQRLTDFVRSNRRVRTQEEK